MPLVSLNNLVYQWGTYLHCVRSLISQLEWLLRIGDILVDELVNELFDRINTAGSTVLVVISVNYISAGQ